jgi:hypothetical protein
MPACRVFSTLPYYVKAKRLLDSNVKAIFVASQYAPESLALAAAAHQSGKRVFLANHANATWRDRYVPPIHADLVATTSEAVARMYQAHSKTALEFVYWTSDTLSEPMRRLTGRQEELKVGIYLTALSNEKRLNEILTSWFNALTPTQVFVRPHPAKIVSPRLDHVSFEHPRCIVSIDAPLSDDIDRTDLAICGNSTVATELLRAGRPVLYDHRLDGLPFDYNGYLAAGLVMPQSEPIDEQTLARIDDFYSSHGWDKAMRHFDYGYLKDEQSVMDELGRKIEDTLRDGTAHTNADRNC